MAPLTCWIYRFVPTRPAMLTDGLNAAETAAFQRHSAYLNRLASDGVAIVVGRTLVRDERNFALAIINAATEEQPRLVMENDPFVREGVVRAELFPFQLLHLVPENAAIQDGAAD